MFVAVIYGRGEFVFFSCIIMDNMSDVALSCVIFRLVSSVTMSRLTLPRKSLSVIGLLFITKSLIAFFHTRKQGRQNAFSNSFLIVYALCKEINFVLTENFMTGRKAQHFSSFLLRIFGLKMAVRKFI